MKGMVIESSIAASWLLEDEADDRADWILKKLQAGVPAAAPSLWLLEINNVLVKAERQKRIVRSYREDAFDQLERLPISILPAPTMPDLKVMRFFADKHQLSIYDAEYLRVAKEYKLLLATLDQNLITAAAREKTLLVPGD